MAHNWHTIKQKDLALKLALINISYFWRNLNTTMRKILALLLTMCLSAHLYAQKDGNYNYSLGLRAYSLLQFPKILNQTNADDFTESAVYGAMLKFNDNQLSYRISVNYLDKDQTFNNQCNTCQIASGKVKDFQAKIGFEKTINYSTLQPYLGFDLGFRSTNFNGELDQNPPTSTHYNAESSKNGFTFGPVLGFKLNLIKQLSFFAETSLDFYYSYERQETIQNDANNTRTFTKYNKLETLFNPVSLGLQLHLVEKN